MKGKEVSSFNLRRRVVLCNMFRWTFGIYCWRLWSRTLFACALCKKHNSGKWCLPMPALQRRHHSIQIAFDQIKIIRIILKSFDHQIGYERFREFSPLHFQWFCLNITSKKYEYFFKVTFHGFAAYLKDYLSARFLSKSILRGFTFFNLRCFLLKKNKRVQNWRRL